ncbi:MAG: transcriptional regulator GntR family [Bacillota bacterium]|jgi:DNA-binding GntR family transcriptional regulator|nr:transcriptional regulator GntR family [Bacillota bacterium]
MERINYVQKKKNLREIAYSQLKDDIFKNRIKPGDCLSENLIASEFNMSRTPVREALRMLESEDLVEIKDGIGIYVKTISFKDIKDIFEVRKAIETLAIKTSINRIMDYEVDELREKFIDLLNEHEHGVDVSLEKFASVDWELDELIVNKCNNDYIISIIKEINAKIRRYQYLSHEAYNDVKESTEQHLKILSLIKEKKLEELIEENEKHIDWALNCFLK